MLEQQQTRHEPARAAPVSAVTGVELPRDNLAYRVKNKLLGPPLHNEDLAHERLGNPTALAVFASDNLSSSAYATESILHVLVPAVGVAAFSLVMPITFAMLVVLSLLILSYRQTIKAYPMAGSAYLVTKDNFGKKPALIADVSLLTDYVLTVAVSVTTGTTALVSAFPGFEPYRIVLSIGFIALIAYGNLRGVRESGRMFAVPTYFFMANMAVLLAVGIAKHLTDGLPRVAVEAGALEFGDAGSGLLMGATVYVVLHAFASGGTAVTGVEAISDGVPAFRAPEWLNARKTLTIMGGCLGVMFLGLSFLASRVHAVPYEHEIPTVLSQVGEIIYGTGALGRTMFLSLQAATMLILVLAANTSFADFPRLANFQAGDNFLPRQLTKRGHRLVFSNGILALSAAAALLVVITGAKVHRLIPLYAIGVFTGFTLSQASMTRRHLRLKETGWKRGVAINGVGATVSALVALIFGVTKFTEGAWVIIVAVPLLVGLLIRLSHQYEREAVTLEKDVPQAATAPILKRHVVLVFIDRLDLAAARAIQYARTLTPDELRAVHFVADHVIADELRTSWEHLGLNRVPLELVDCPDRRLTRAAVETVARELADGETEVSVLLPDRKYSGFWHRILHDQTAEQITQAVSRLPHANVTTVPFHFGVDHTPTPLRSELTGNGGRRPSKARGARGAVADVPLHPASGITPCGVAQWRQHVKLTGTIGSMRVQPRGGVPSLECTLVDETGGILIVFLGRRRIAGIETGARITVEGRVSDHHGQLALLNPTYQLLSS